MTAAAPEWLAAELSAGERVLWTGQPLQGLRIDPTTLIINLFGLGVLIIGLAWNSLVLWALGIFDGSHESGVFRAVMWVAYLGTLLMGYHMTIGIYFGMARVRRRTSYAVTDRAAYIRQVRGWRGAAVSRHVITRASEIKAGGLLARRSVSFDYRFEEDSDTGEIRRRGVWFHDLPDPASTLALLRKVRENRT